MQRKHIYTLVSVLAGISFLVPLIVFPNHFIFPFIVPKILTLRIISILMFVGYVVAYLGTGHRRKKMSPLDMAVLFFAASFLLSTITSFDWYRSLWDNHERMLGFFTLIHYVAYYWVLTRMIGTKSVTWHWLNRVFMLCATAVMIIGFIQKMYPDFLLNQGSGRVSATLGNAIYYSGYGFFLLVIGLLNYVNEKQIAYKVVSVLCAVAGFAGIFAGGTRGTFIGLVGALFFALVLYAFLYRQRKMRYIFQSLLAIVIIAGALLFVFRASEPVKDIPVLGKLINTSLSEGTANTRIMAWEIAIEGWKERPILGWGPNNYFYVFNKHYNPAFLHHGIAETWFDNAHNHFMNTLATHGTLGILALLSLYITPIILLAGAYKKRIISVHVAVITSSFFVGHGLHNFFVFENPTSYLYFFFFLAYIHSITQKKDEEHETKEVTSRSISNQRLIVTTLLALLFIYSTNINPAKANMTTLKTLGALYARNPLFAQLHTQAVSTPTPHIDDIRNDVVRAVINVMNAYAREGKPDEAVYMFEVAYDEIKKNRLLHPHDIRITMLDASLTRMAAMMFGRTDLLIDTEQSLMSTIAESPKRQQLHYLLSGVKFMLGKPNESVALLEKTIQDDPGVPEGWWRLALVYNEVGLPEKADEVFERAIAQGVRFSEGQRVEMGKIVERYDAVLESVSTE